jgi:small conductance mechanosensitive channel
VGRALLDVRFATDTDIDRALEVARTGTTTFYETRAAGDAVLEAPQVLGIESFVDGAPVLRVSVKTQPGRQTEVARQLRAELRRAFEAAGISMTGATSGSPGA